MANVTSINGLVTKENHTEVNIISKIVKQDIAIQNAVDALNGLIHTQLFQFEEFKNEYGVGGDLLTEIRQLHDKLKKAKHGRF
jgi:hypothetical protein